MHAMERLANSILLSFLGTPENMRYSVPRFRISIEHAKHAESTSESCQHSKKGSPKVWTSIDTMMEGYIPFRFK